MRSLAIGFSAPGLATARRDRSLDLSSSRDGVPSRNSATSAQSKLPLSTSWRGGRGVRCSDTPRPPMRPLRLRGVNKRKAGQPDD